MRTQQIDWLIDDNLTFSPGWTLRRTELYVAANKEIPCSSGSMIKIKILIPFLSSHILKYQEKNVECSKAGLTQFIIIVTKILSR